jgi:hypothetical protein
MQSPFLKRGLPLSSFSWNKKKQKELHALGTAMRVKKQDSYP